MADELPDRIPEPLEGVDPPSNLPEPCPTLRQLIWERITSLFTR